MARNSRRPWCDNISHVIDGVSEWVVSWMENEAVEIEAVGNDLIARSKLDQTGIYVSFRGIPR